MPKGHSNNWLGLVPSVGAWWRVEETGKFMEKRAGQWKAGCTLGFGGFQAASGQGTHPVWPVVNVKVGKVLDIYELLGMRYWWSYSNWWNSGSMESRRQRWQAQRWCHSWRKVLWRCQAQWCGGMPWNQKLGIGEYRSNWPCILGCALIFYFIFIHLLLLYR